MPDFDSRGNLPPKCWEVTLDDIKENLVDNFPYSTNKVKPIFNVFQDSKMN